MLSALLNRFTGFVTAKRVILNRILTRLGRRHSTASIARCHAACKSCGQLAQRADLLFLAFAQLVCGFAREQLPGDVARRQFAAAGAQPVRSNRRLKRSKAAVK